MDDLNICNIVLEHPPTFDDYYQSVECKMMLMIKIFLISDVFSLDYKFESEKNSLYLTREYYQDFSCEFDLGYYPFDTQVNKHVAKKLLKTQTSYSRKCLDIKIDLTH